MKKLVHLILVFIFFYTYSNTVNSFEIKQKNLIKPYCKGKIGFDSTNIYTQSKKPKKIEVVFNNQRKYYKNFIRLIKTLGNYPETKIISKTFKKFEYAEVYAHYENNIICKFKAKARITGSKGTHVSKTDLISSLSIQLEDGNILHKNKFLLLIPRARFNENEIFIASLFQEINFLSPITFYVETEINGTKAGKFIFQEKISLSTISHNKRGKGIILAANKRSQFKSVIDGYNKDSPLQLNLGMAVESGNYSSEIITNAIDKINYLILQKYDQRHLYHHHAKMILNNNNLHIKKSHIYELIMIAAGAAHGITREDRRFFYDFLNDSLEPIYFDGKSLIFEKSFVLDEKILKSLDYPYINDKQAVIDAKKIISDIDKEEFNYRLNLNGLKTDINKIDYIIKMILDNLDVILNFKAEPSVKNFNPKYFLELDQNKDLNFELAFGGRDNVFTICKIDLSICKIEKFNSDQTNKIFNNQIISIKNKYLFYVRSSTEAYKGNIIPKSGINKMKKITINSDFNIFHNEKILVKVDNENKIINFDMINNSGRAIIKSNKIKNWVFKLNGLNKNFNYDDLDYYYMQPNSCITFLNSSFDMISLSSNNIECPNTFQFISSVGTINDVKINNSKYDAFDADFSNLKIMNIEVNYAGQECVGVKTGNYEIINAKLSNCLDKAISSGELAVLSIDKVNILNSHFGLAAKDSSKIFAENVSISKSDLCLFAYRSKYEYQSSIINTKKKKYHCDNNTFFIQKGSVWNNLSN